MKYKIDNRQNLVACKPDQDFTFEQLFQHLTELLLDPSFKLGMNAIYDFTLVSNVSGDLEALLKTAETMENTDVISKQANVSIIVDSSNTTMFKVFEGYCLMASNSLVNYRLFTDEHYPLALEFAGCENMPAFN